MNVLANLTAFLTKPFHSARKWLAARKLAALRANITARLLAARPALKIENDDDTDGLLVNEVYVIGTDGGLWVGRLIFWPGSVDRRGDVVEGPGNDIVDESEVATIEEAVAGLLALMDKQAAEAEAEAEAERAAEAAWESDVAAGEGQNYRDAEAEAEITDERLAALDAQLDAAEAAMRAAGTWRTDAAADAEEARAAGLTGEPRATNLPHEKE